MVESEPVVLPPLLQKDPLWDSTLDDLEAIGGDAMLGDRLALVAAKLGGLRGFESAESCWKREIRGF